ncbi:hypothetical protein KX928_18030 [Roseobacter sp. YSTF-M11]|uniref:Uncharacterized protein n=1 Tax=Roseobacter insulae TaxID=2859783 RepID=A0A9X1FZ41_9RHOB|nr:hypothetical protein [Roseobacter insulae]MBW4709690.1 hypothetical protein [Roseobacter insulae]
MTRMRYFALVAASMLVVFVSTLLIPMVLEFAVAKGYQGPLVPGLMLFLFASVVFTVFIRVGRAGVERRENSRVDTKQTLLDLKLPFFLPLSAASAFSVFATIIFPMSLAMGIHHDGFQGVWRSAPWLILFIPMLAKEQSENLNAMR